MATGHGGPRPGAGRKPGKVSKAKLDIAERAKSHGEAALAVLYEVMKDKQAPHAARVSAANAVLDRGYGKPTQVMAGDPDAPLAVTMVTRRIVDPGGTDD